MVRQKEYGSLLSPSLLSLFGIFAEKSSHPLKSFEQFENKKILDKAEEKLIEQESLIAEQIEGQGKSEGSMWIT